jgi:hypothetical protein
MKKRNCWIEKNERVRMSRDYITSERTPRADIVPSGYGKEVHGMYSGE